MSKSSSDEELLEKIHQILDESSAESEKKRHDRYLSSLERRLSHEQRIGHPSRSSHQSSDKNLTPRVVIRKQQKPVQQKERKQEGKIVTFKEGVRFIPAEDLHLSDTELFEVEKPPLRPEEIPEFIEVKPEQKEETEEPVFKKEKPSEEEPLTITISSETSEEDESLPQWQAIEEKEEKEEPVEKPITKRKRRGFFKPEEEKKEKTQTFSESEKQPLKKIEKTSDDIWEPLDEKKKESSSNNETKRIEKTPDKEQTKKKGKKSSSDQKVNKKSGEEKKNEEKNKSQSDSPGFQYNDYILFQKTIKISDKEKRTIHFFAKEPPETGEPAELPEDYEVKINRKTGVPYIRKKQQ